MQIDIPLVQKLIASQFPRWANLSISQVKPGGWDNRTFRLGDDMLVRLPSAERYAEKVEKEQAWLPYLGSKLSTPIPAPLEMGRPQCGYPWNWSIYNWIEGEDAAHGQITDRTNFAKSLAGFLNSLQSIEPLPGTDPGPHNFFRGGSLRVYDTETRNAIRSLGKDVDADHITKVWETALSSNWTKDPVWLHGDFSPGNILVHKGELKAVIDFGGTATGDPSCDLAIAWTFFEGCSRDAFRSSLSLDKATWSRARGWAIWKALIILEEHLGLDPSKEARARETIDTILREDSSAES